MVSQEFKLAQERIAALTAEGQLEMLARLFDYLEPDARMIVVIIARSLARFHEQFRDPLAANSNALTS